MSNKEKADSLEIIAPVPGAIFKRDHNTPHNLERLTSVRNPKTLPKREVVLMQARINEIRGGLADYGYWQKEREMHLHMQAVARLKRQWDNMPPDERNDDLKEHIRNAVNQHKPTAYAIKEELSALRPLVQELNDLEARLNEHLIAVENKRLYPRLRTATRREVGFFAKGLVSVLTQMGFVEEITVAMGARRGKRYKKIKIERAVATEDEIQIKIKTGFLTLLRSYQSVVPRGVLLHELYKDETLAQIAAHVECPVSSPNNTGDVQPNDGVYFVFHRVDMNDGLFNYVGLREMLAKYPREQKDKFPFPVGVARGRYAKYSYLDEQPHIMVNGRTGSGKTNWLRAVLNCLISQHSPKELRLYITDLKLGADFNYYADIPHLEMPIIKDPYLLSELIQKLVLLMQERMRELSRRNANNITEYNALGTDTPMPRVIVLIDEMTAVNGGLQYDKDEKKSFWVAMNKLSTQARAAGIHLFLGTQQSFSESIPKEVRDNVTFVLSGKQRTLGGSMGTFGDSRAKQLPNITGRMWCDDGEQYLVQTPHASRKDTDKAVQIALAYDKEPPLFAGEIGTGLALIEVNTDLIVSETPKEMLVRCALEEFEGLLQGRKIWEHLNTPQLSQRGAYDLIQRLIEERVIQYQGQYYEVLKDGRSWRLSPMQARTLEAAETHQSH